MENIIEDLRKRGLVKQTVFEDEMIQHFNSGMVSCYCGFDPSGTSLQVGNLVALLLLRRLQLAGHKPYVLVGGATATIGDPSGKNDMREMMSMEQINSNAQAIKKQLERFISFEGKNAAVMVNNADWILKLNWVEFIRDIGPHLNVNKMLSAECFKRRMKTGLTFLEFNYMPMQAYDFLHLNKTFGVTVQVGGDDQWSNILAGADLIRIKEKKKAFCFTNPLLTDANGQKMGKTAGGALYLDANKTAPNEIFQYFRNVDDRTVKNCLCMLTFVPLNEIDLLTQFNDERMNLAKERLAFEIVKLIHGEDIATECLSNAKSAFSGGGALQEFVIKSVNILDILVETKLASSKGEARRLIEGGGVKIDNETVKDFTLNIDKKEFILSKGKKNIVKVKR